MQERVVAAPAAVAAAATMASVDANKTTGYEVFVQKCFSQHKFQNPEKVKVKILLKRCVVLLSLVKKKICLLKRGYFLYLFNNLLDIILQFY